MMTTTLFTQYVSTSNVQSFGNEKILRFNLGLELRQKNVILYMHAYVAAAIHKLQNNKPYCLQDSPHPWTKLTYGHNIQQLAKQSISSQN